MDSKLKWDVFVWSETGVSLCFNCSTDTWGENRLRDTISQNVLSQIKIPATNIAIEMTSLWHKTPCFIPMQNFWQDSEHHVWIVREKSKKRRGKKGLIGLSEERGRTFWGRSQAWNQENSFNIPNPGGVAVLQEGRRGEREGGVGETSAWDMMRLGMREGEKRRRDELLMAQQVWPPLGNTGAWEEGRSPLRKGQREGESVCLYLYLCVCVCVASARRASYSTTHNDSPPSPLQSMSRLPIGNDRGPMRTPFSPHVNQLGQSNGKGKLCHYEMHS